MKHLRTFALSIGKDYQNLAPDADMVSPNKTHVIRGYEGWAYCARTEDKSIFLAYFEKGVPRAQVRGAKLIGLYKAQWFNPREGLDGRGRRDRARAVLPEVPHHLR